MKRREFTRDVSAEIMRRVKEPTGFRCEWCRGIVTKGEIHHLKQDAMEIDKRRKLTATDGAFLCEPCHDAESARQAPIIAKVKRVEANHLGVKTPSAKPIQSAPFAKAERASKISQGGKITKQPVPNNSQIAQMWRANQEPGE